MAILDQYGNPIQQTQLREPQTARAEFLQREFAAHPSRGLTPEKLASILQQAEEGDLIAQAELGQDMWEKDSHIFGELQRRIKALSSLDWDILPPVDATAAEKQAAKDIKRILDENLDVGDIVEDAASAILMAYAGLEFPGWERDGSGWLPRQPEFREASWFTVDRQTRTKLALRSAGNIDGEPLWPFGWILHTHRSKSGYIGRGGLVRVLAWPYLFGAYNAQDLAELMRVLGLPTIFGKYPSDASPSEKSSLLKALISIGKNARGIMPQGMEIEIHEAANGDTDAFEFSLGYWDKRKSKAILGTALSTETGPNGNRSVGEVGLEVFGMLRKSDAKQLAKTLSRDLVYAVGTLNGLVKDRRRLPRFIFDTQDPADLKLYSEAIPALVDVGLPVPVGHVREKLKIPAAKEGEAVLARPAAPTAPPIPPAAATARLGGGHAHTSDCPVCAAAAAIVQPDALDNLRDLALDGWQVAMEPVVNPLFAALDAAIADGQSVAEFRASLPALVESMDIAALTAALTDPAFMARMAGEVGADVS